MAIIDVTEYKIGENTYRYRDASMIEELAEKVNYSDVEATLDDTSEMPIQNQAVANAITALDNDKLNISDIDDEFDNTSTNPLQNKVITDKINDIGGLASNSHAGIVKVGDSLTMDIIDENPGFLNIRYPAYINPSYTGEDDTTIATYTDNLGNSGVIKVPASVGTEVIPNPVEPATGTLTKIQIDDTVYNIAGSGGGGGPSRVDLLYINSGTTFDNITLLQAYTNYDIICFTVMTDLAENDEKTSTFFGKDQLQVNDYIRLHGSTTTSNWLKYQIESTTGFSKVATATSEYVSTVYGIKLGGGSQVSVTPEYSTGTLLATVSIDNDDIEIYAAPEYELPIAGASTLGGVKVGSGLSIDSSTGVLSATGGGATELDDLTDVSIDDQTLANGQVLKYNGTNWVNAADSGGTITDVEVDGTSVVSSGVASINTMTGAGASAAGSKGLVPAPASGDNEKFLRGDGTWQTVSGGSAAVSTLTDVDLTNLSNGQILKYNTSTNKWENANESGGGSSTLAGLSDVTLTSIVDGQILQYSNGDWVNVTPASLSGYVTAGAAAGSTVGPNATAEGYDVYSTDYQSHAEGEGTSALAGNAHAEGAGTSAAGVRSHAEGDRTRALAANCHSEGYATWATNNSAHAEGEETTASGFCSHAEGQYTNANYGYTHAEGVNTIAAGSAAHSEGGSTYAAEEASHAEGCWTTALGYRAHSEGYYTSAKGDNSHAEGYHTTAYGNSSHAEGYQTSAYSQASHAEGASTCAVGVNSHAEGYQTCASGYYSHAEGYQNKTSGGSSHVEGYSNTIMANNSHAEGRLNRIEINSEGAHAEGSGCTIAANSLYAHVGGENSYTSGNSAFAQGSRVKAIGIGAHAEGCYTCACANGAHAEGGRTSGYNIEGTFAMGVNSHSEGLFTSAVGNHSHAGGFATCSMADCSTAIGKYNAPTADYAFTVGNGTDNNNRSNAFAVKWDGSIEIGGSPFNPGYATYSTSEMVIGTWIDGKPIYRKVFDYSAAPLHNAQEIDITDLNIDTLINSNGLGRDYESSTAYPRWSLNSVSANNGRLIYLKDATTLKVEGAYWISYIIIEYTKNTV